MEGDREVRALLREMQARASDASAVWPAVGDEVARQVGLQFDSEGAHFGTPWSPRQPPNPGRKVTTDPAWDPMRPDFGGGPLLVETGALRDSFRSQPMTYSPTAATFGSDDYRAKFHHCGTENLPARPLLRATDDLAEDVSDVLARYIVEGRVS